MKTPFIFALVFFSALVLQSQNWSPIFTGGAVHFETISGYMVPYRIDSVVQLGDTTDYYSFYMIRQLDNDFSTLKGGSILGKKIERRPNGEWRFYNFENKPLLINQEALNQQSWVFYAFDDGSYFMAKVVDIDTMLVFNQIDSVKQICLQYYNAGGVASDHLYSNDTLLLSRHFGLLTAFDFYYFPYAYYDFNDFSSYYFFGKLTLAGIEELRLGYKNITTRDIFNYHVDDELHLYQINSGNCDIFTEYKTIRKIVDKDSASSDVLNYTAEYCTRKQSYYVNSGAVTIDTFHFVNNISYNINNYALINKLGFEPFFNNGFYTYLSATRNYKKISGNIIYYPFNADTIQFMMVDGYTDSYYYKELGGPYNADMVFDDCGNNFYIQYFRINGFEFGIPYDCRVLLPVEKTDANEVTIFPNPAGQKIFINTRNQFIKAAVYNRDGCKLIEIDQKHDDGTDISGLPDGLYILKIQTSGGVVVKKLIKI